MEINQLLWKVGANIKRIREEKHVKQQDLAAMCNYEKSNFSKIESGETNITLKTLNKIAVALEIPEWELLK